MAKEYNRAGEPVETGHDGLKRLTPQEAADVIREDVEGSPAVDVNVQHTMKYCTEVCHHLGIEPNPVNMQRVADALKDAGIEPGHPDEFPKYVVVGQDAHGHDVSVIVNNPDEEAEATGGKGPLAGPALVTANLAIESRDYGKSKEQLESEAVARDRRRELSKEMAAGVQPVPKQGFTDVNEAQRHR